MNTTNAVAFPLPEGNPGRSAGKPFDIRFPSSNPQGDPRVRAGETKDGSTEIGEADYVVDQEVGLLVDEVRYKRAHDDGNKCRHCHVLWTGPRSSKARSDSWYLCEVLLMMKRGEDLRGQRVFYPELEGSLTAAGIKRTHYAIIKCYREVRKSRDIENGPYSEHWKIFRSMSEYAVPEATITVRKRTARVADLPSPSQIGFRTRRQQENQTEIGTERSDTVTGAAITLDTNKDSENPREVVTLQDSEGMNGRGSVPSGTVNDADGRVSISDPFRLRKSHSQKRVDTPDIVTPEMEDMWEANYVAQLKGALRTTERPRLPKLKNMSSAEQAWVGYKVEMARLECVSHSVEQQWSQANAVLYAAVKSIAVSRPLNKVREAHKTWLNNRKMEEKRLRRIIGRIETVTCMPKGKRTPAQIKLAANINQLKSKSFPDMDWTGMRTFFATKLEQLKQKISVRVAEYERKTSRRAAGQYGKSVTRSQGFTPDVDSATTYWAGLALPGPKTFKQNSLIFQTWKDSVVNSMNTEPVLLYPLIVECIKKPSPWKAPGPDGIFNYYWRQGFIMNWLEVLIKRTMDVGEFPRSLSGGRTVLLYKSGDKNMPENYRPITCLNGCFKMANAVVTKVIIHRVKDTIALPTEQMALKEKVWACMESQLRDQALQAEIGNDCMTAWIDFSKAYDSIDHGAIRFVIETLDLPDGMKKYLLTSLSNWRTRLVLTNGGKVALGKPYAIKRGVLQGDSLSPALFVLVTSPIVHHLKHVCPTGHIQLYMDDIKLYGRSETELNTLIRETQRVANRLGLEMNLKKCAVYGQGIQREIAGFDPLGDRTYKYLGIPQRDVPDINSAYEELRNKNTRSIEDTMACDYLTVRQVITRLNAKIAPLVRFVVQSALTRVDKAKWIYNELTIQDSWYRKLLAQLGLRYHKSNVARLYLATKENGFGLVNTQQVMVEAVVSRAIYCLRAPSLEDRRAGILTAGFDPVGTARNILKRCGIEIDLDSVSMASAMQTIKATYQTRWLQLFQNTKLYQKWVENKIDIPNSSRWLQTGGISPRNARLAIAIQDNTLLCKGFVGSKEVDKRCRMCKQGIETVSHIVTECSYHRAHMYIERHDAVGRNVYAYLAKKHDIEIPHYSQRVPTVVKTESCELYWNYKFPCIRPLEACRPDIVMIDKVKRRILVTEIAVSYVTRLDQMVKRKKYKYATNGEAEADGESRGWCIVRELAEAYNMPVDLCIVVIGASGEVLPCTVKAIEKITKDGSSRSLLERCQRSAVLGSARAVLRHLA